MKLIYIASPLFGDIDGNMEQARIYCRFAVEQGVNVYCPHIFLTQFMSDVDPVERKLAMKMGKQVMQKCDELWCFYSQPSAGMREEMECAKALGIPIRQFPAMPELELIQESGEKFCISTQVI